MSKKESIIEKIGLYLRLVIIGTMIGGILMYEPILYWSIVWDLDWSVIQFSFTTGFILALIGVLLDILTSQ
jgi:hypothetical protein